MKKFLLFPIFLLSLFLIVSASKTEILKEASFYTKLAKKYVRCDLCPNNCVLKKNEIGICGARQNIDGKLYSLVYGKPVAVHIDPIEKKPLFHFLPGSKALSIATAGCNLRCNFCQNWEISQSKPNEVPAYDLSPEEVVRMALENHCESIAFTYTEPTIFYEYMIDIAKLAKQKNIKTVWITCGYINEKPLRNLCKYLDAANIDLKGFSENFYKTYTTGELTPVLNTIKIAKQESLYFELTNLVIPDANDNPKIIKNMCNWIVENVGKDVPLHFSRFFPKYRLLNRPPTPWKTLESARKIAVEAGIKFVYIGNVSSEFEDTYCPRCGKKIIDRSGYEIRTNHIKNGKCEFCGETIPGYFSK